MTEPSFSATPSDRPAKGLVVISGGTGGIGSAAAMLLAQQGYTPVIGHRAGKSAEAFELASACDGLALALDMADPQSIDSAVTALAQDARPTIGLILAASPPPALAPFGRITEQDHTLFWTANVVGPQRLLAGLIRHCFRPRKAGSVVAVLTQAMGSGSRKAMAGMGAYTISKYGLHGVMALAQAEYAWLNVTCVSPGFTETPMLEAFDERFLAMVRERESFSSPASIAAEIVAHLNLSALPPL